MANVTREEVARIHNIFSLVVAWSGASDDTPDDTEVLYVNGQALTLGDIKDAVTSLNTLSDLAGVR